MGRFFGVRFGACNTFKDGFVERPAPRPEEDNSDAVAFARTRFGFVPDEVQARVLASTSRRGIINCTRQWGKSTLGAAKAVHRAFTRPDSLIIVATPGERQSGEFLRKARHMVMKMKMEPRGDGDNKISLAFPNGSRIVGLPGVEGTVRGFSAVSMMIIDEASQVRDEMYKALRPMLAVGRGDLWLMSTPRGKRGFFYSTWAHGRGEWERFTVQATACPRIDPEHLEEERDSIGVDWFRQEYMCEFVDGGGGMFGRDMVEEALDDDFDPLPLAPNSIWRN